jgi:hypothetical protein
MLRENAEPSEERAGTFVVIKEASKRKDEECQSACPKGATVQCKAAGDESVKLTRRLLAT